MLKMNAKLLNRDQFIKLREAKRLIKQEFDISISLSDEDVLDIIYGYALESEEEQLFDIVEFLNQSNPTSQDSPPSPETQKNNPIDKAPKQQENLNNKIGDLFSRRQKWQVGEIVDGRKIVRMYRGAPVFEDA